MTDEEKKAIESLKKDLDCTVITFCKAGLEDIKIVLNLIEKQFKEIEELKENNEFLNWYFENQKENFIHKDKIKAKIEEIDFMIKEINQGHLQKYTVGELLGAKRFLESLLEKE